MKSDIEFNNTCCNHLKKDPIKKFLKETNKHPIIFTRVEESVLRLNSWKQTGCVSLGDHPTCKPLSVWTEKDVELGIIKYEVQLSKEYTEYGYLRTGCRSCPYGCQFEKGENRFQKNAKYYPTQHANDMNDMGMGDILDLMNIDYN